MTGVFWVAQLSHLVYPLLPKIASSERDACSALLRPTEHMLMYRLGALCSSSLHGRQTLPSSVRVGTLTLVFEGVVTWRR